jgi:hypothetical protein
MAGTLEAAVIDIDQDDLPTVTGYRQLYALALEQLKEAEPDWTPKRRERVARAMTEAYCHGAVERVQCGRSATVGITSTVGDDAASDRPGEASQEPRATVVMSTTVGGTPPSRSSWPVEGQSPTTGGDAAHTCAVERCRGASHAEEGR